MLNTKVGIKSKQTMKMGRCLAVVITVSLRVSERMTHGVIVAVIQVTAA